MVKKNVNYTFKVCGLNKIDQKFKIQISFFIFFNSYHCDLLSLPTLLTLRVSSIIRENNFDRFFNSIYFDKSTFFVCYRKYNHTFRLLNRVNTFYLLNRNYVVLNFIFQYLALSILFCFK